MAPTAHRKSGPPLILGVMSTNLLGGAAALFGVAMGLSPLLSLRRVLRTGSARDLSLGAVAVVFFGGVVWLAYGVRVSNLPVIATNLAGAGAAGGCLVVGLAMRADAGRARARSHSRARHEQSASNRPTTRGTSGADSFQHRWEKPRRFSTRRWGAVGRVPPDARREAALDERR